MVRDEKEITPEQIKKLERWAKQIKHGDLSPLEGLKSKGTASGTGPIAAAGKLKTPSASKVATPESSTPAKGTPRETPTPAKGTPSRAKLKTPSAGKIKTPSAGKTAASGTGPVAPPEKASGSSAGRTGVGKRRKLRQSSMQMPAVAPASSDESATAVADAPEASAVDEATKDVKGSPDAPGRVSPDPARLFSPTPSAMRLKTGTPSRKGVDAASMPRASSTGLLAIAGSALLASALIGGAVAMKVVGDKDQPAKPLVADSKPVVTPTTAPKLVPVAVDPGSTNHPGSSSLDDERANRALYAAATLERDSKEDEAVLALDAALETASGDSRAKLIDAKNQLISRLRDQIDRAKALAMAGKPDDARKLLAALRGHSPDALVSDLDAADRDVNARGSKTGTSAGDDDKKLIPAKAAGDAPEPTKPAAEKPKPADDPAARRLEELARVGVARAAVSKALLDIDIAGATKALDAAGSVSDPDAVAILTLDRKRVESVSKLVKLAATGFRFMAALNKTGVDLDLRDGSHVIGKVASADTKTVVITTKTGDVPLPLEMLSQDCLLRTAYLGAADEPEPYFFGRGVLLLCAGDRKGALEAFTQAPSVPESATMITALATHDTGFTAGGVGGGLTGEKKKPDPAAGPVVVGGDDDGPAKPHVKTWMDDTEGGVPWEQAVDYPSKHYTLHTNVKKEYALRYVKLLEAIASRYEMIFDFHGNDFAYNKNMVLLYRTQEEFMSYESESANVGGFYNPSDKKLHLFHGPWKGADEISTLNVIAHEAVHQFQNLVLHQMDHAPTFVIEGFSTWAEGSVVATNGDVIVGAISVARLKDMRRAFKAKDFIHLKDLIRTSHSEFLGFHYAHTWGLFHWCFFGPESGFAHDYKPIGKSMKLLLAYWQMCCDKPTTARDFEDLLKQYLGWDMNQLEKAWKDWILSLDPAHDPEIEKYEKLTHKKFVNAMGPTDPAK